MEAFAREVERLLSDGGGGRWRRGSMKVPLLWYLH